jgi:hypothetical protein
MQGPNLRPGSTPLELGTRAECDLQASDREAIMRQRVPSETRVMQRDPVQTADVPLADRDSTRAPDRRRPRAGRWLEWLTRRDALALAERDEAARADDHVLLVRGGDAVRAADRLLDPPDGSRSQPALAMVLYREACRWLLASMHVAAEEPALGSLLARASTALPELGLAPPARAVADTLAFDPATFSALTEGEQRARAHAVQGWLGTLLERQELTHGAALRLRFERGVRVGALAIVVATFTTAGVLGVIAARRGPDLAAGKPWRASSSFEQCHPEQRWCAGARTTIFFHTQQDPAPWLEIDLESVQRISRVEVTNRSDYGPERAVPLLIELSSDGVKYWPVASRAIVFTQWDATFPPRSARYVRLTVQRPSYFHLERVSVRR